MRNHNHVFFASVLSLAQVVIFTVSCSPGRHAAIELDKVARSLDRYGFASISTPFISGPADEFEFDLDKPAIDYFEMAFKPQGGVRHFRAEAQDVQAAFRVNIEQGLATVLEFQKIRSLTEFRETKAKARNTKALLESMKTTVPGIGGNPAVTALEGLLGVVIDTPEPEGLPEYAPKTEGLPEKGPVFTADQLTALKALGVKISEGLKLPEDTYQISAREAMLIASGDVTTQALLKWFNKPHGNKLANYELLFCPMIVSVQPGFQTRNQYLADITVNVDLARPGNWCKCKHYGRSKCDKHLSFLSEQFSDSSPPILVTGVFPVIDAQVLNLVNSRRQLYSVALQLSMMGFGTQGDFFINQAKKLESDAQTQTSLTVASAYTVGDTAFGFRIEPKFVASKDPTLLVTEPGRILESRTFPALAAVLVDRKYLKDASTNECCCLTGNSKDPACDPRDCGNDQNDLYEYLVFESSTRWSPMTETRSILGGAFSFGGRLSEVEIWQRSLALDKTEKWLRGQPTLFTGTLDASHHFLVPGIVGSKFQRRHLETRIKNLSKLALDSRAIVRIFDTSPAKRICVERVVPQHGWKDQYTVLTIRGMGFKNNVKAITVGGVLCEFAIPNDRTILALVPPWSQPNKKLPHYIKHFGDSVSTIAKVSSLGAEMSYPIAIAARVPVCCGSACQSTYDTFPANKDCDTASDCNTIGRIKFDWSLPQKPGGDDSSRDNVGEGELKIIRDPEGKIIGIKTKSESLEDAKEILKLISSGECCEGDSLNLEIEASGSARIKAKGKTRK